MKTPIPLPRAGRLGDLPTLLDTVPGLSAKDAEELAHDMAEASRAFPPMPPEDWADENP